MLLHRELPLEITLSASVGLLGFPIQLFPKVLFFRPLPVPEIRGPQASGLPSAKPEARMRCSWFVGAGCQEAGRRGEKPACVCVFFRSLLVVLGLFQKHIE